MCFCVCVWHIVSVLGGREKEQKETVERDSMRERGEGGKRNSKRLKRETERESKGETERGREREKQRER